MSTLDRLKDLTRPTGEEELLDVAYPRPRLHLGVRHAALAAAVVIALAAGLLLFQSRPQPADTLAPGADAFPAVTAAPPETEELVVSVVGAVERPGLVTLHAGARVDDALLQAGLLPDADDVSLNRAQRLSDGQQLVVPRQGEAPAPGETGGGGGVSLNSASATELTALPGVGPATAAAIIAHREATGGFSSLEQLLDVRGIGPAKFESLKEEVTL